jgi:hypothetical protein
MLVRRKKTARQQKNRSDRDADVILTMDPAAVSPSGLCIRPTVNALTEIPGRLRTPEWYSSGNVWNTQMHDELARTLAKWVPRGGHVAFASTTTAFQGTALSIGRAIGCIEGILHDLNVFPDPKVEPVHDVTWRRTMFAPEEWATIHAMKGINISTTARMRRAAWKQLAVDTVKRKYGIECDDNAAEAILLNNYIVMWREDLWKAGATRRYFSLDEWKRGGYGPKK